LQDEYGDDAPFYAENRRAAAQLLGDAQRTQLWSQVVHRLQRGDGV
jgi:hypothetical protein